MNGMTILTRQTNSYICAQHTKKGNGVYTYGEIAPYKGSRQIELRYGDTQDGYYFFYIIENGNILSFGTCDMVGLLYVMNAL